eukprot:m.725 g.725  ORF g.725 m.725 type:complete len:54 (-) comp579_c0_seq1:120-281(-)
MGVGNGIQPKEEHTPASYTMQRKQQKGDNHVASLFLRETNLSDQDDNTEQTPK